MLFLAFIYVLFCFVTNIHSLRYDPSEEQYNLNQNKTAQAPLDYWGEWSDHTYHPSPDNWRFPFYSFIVDRFVNGDPSNDNANGTAWEQDPTGTILRHGGDYKGVQDSLDYLQGLGIKGLYLAGSPLINAPWAADSFSPLDQTLLDKHFGTIQQLRETVDAIHARGMWVILENTMSTMGDLMAFEGYLNTSTPWSFKGHNFVYKTSRQYHDFHPDNAWIDHCEYPRFWDQLGERYDDANTTQMVGCRAGDFDQYGDAGAFEELPEWRKQMSKFAYVQDRLSEWKPWVLDRIIHFSCMQIAMLDIDGFRMDKGLQITVDAQANFSVAMRECARRYGKDNFFIPGEIVNGNLNAAIYVGRGKEPGMKVADLRQAIDPRNAENQSLFIRDPDYSALDSAAFHYTTYRGLQRFLGLDGKLSATGEAPINFVDQWTEVQATNDFINANTGKYDPRHMYGVSNQDVFRWPGITQGTEKQLLGMFVTALEMPGIPMISWGEEQAFYTLDNTASNYVYGRQAMTSSQAWQMHGCYYVGDSNIYNMPFNTTLQSCHDPQIALDHRDPSQPLYNVYKSMFELRSRYPVLNDGWTLQQLSNQTEDIYLPGSGDVPTETGLWSVVRSQAQDVQNFDGVGQGNQSIWLVYTNKNTSQDYNFDCSSSVDRIRTAALIAPFESGVTVQNLFYPYDEWTLETSNYNLGEFLTGSATPNGCLPSMNMTAFGFKAFVPKDKWMKPSPRVTKFLPGHDFRYLSNTSHGETKNLQIQLHYSDEMNCDQIASAITLSSTTSTNLAAKLDRNTITCENVPVADLSDYNAVVPTVWIFSANITDVNHGIHTISVHNATSSDGRASTNSNDTFMFRIGDWNNPMVFPGIANYSATMLSKQGTNTFMINHTASGADQFRYSFDWGSSWSQWQKYTGNPTLTTFHSNRTGTAAQNWEGDHVKVQYWSQKAGSSSHLQEGDLEGSRAAARRWPNLFLHGPWNQYGYDAGLDNQFAQDTAGFWNFNFMSEWPAKWQANVWGMNPDGYPDQTGAYGDVDGDGVLDRIQPVTLELSVANITSPPPKQYLAYWIHINDGDLRYYYIPIGSANLQLVLYLLLLLIPALSGSIAVYLYLRSFYQVKHNRYGILDKGTLVPVMVKQRAYELVYQASEKIGVHHPVVPRLQLNGYFSDLAVNEAKREDSGTRRVLIATMEYDIEDWAIKIKIGGLGVMAQLMGKNLQHQELIWVVPCVGGIDYPVDCPGDAITVSIFGKPVEVLVNYHKLNNITYVLLDSPVFRAQSKSEPYPARMDDLESATYYSTWNQSIAEVIRRFKPDLYHINDYHGTIAPLYLLPETLPCCLSLHNAEFQGLWPLRTRKQIEEVCNVFNLPEDVVTRYVQFGEVFNLLHAGASILRLHQHGFGAVGVSSKYGKRAFARYPIFWGLNKIGGLPNPDPTDLAEVSPAKLEHHVDVDESYEKSRVEPRLQAQRWAGLEEDASAELFVFVGRWSMQKGIDLIADVFPSILETNKKAQLLCVGPVIDLHGKFAALKLSKLVTRYPGRVFSKPEFTALPPFIFSGAEFALIPSRDEPFGLVAVEFGRKGALGVGSRVGGLGQMPGWWFTIESTTTKHMLRQFKECIQSALASKHSTRAKMRAVSAKQRFPVAQWKHDLEILQSTSIELYNKYMKEGGQRHFKFGAFKSIQNLSCMVDDRRSGRTTPNTAAQNSPLLGPVVEVTPPNSQPILGSSTALPISTDGGRQFGPGHGPHASEDAGPSIPPTRRNSVTVFDAKDLFGPDGASGPLEFGLSDNSPTPESIDMRISALFRESLDITALPDYMALDPPRQSSEKDNRELQNVEPFFNDPTGLYYRNFEHKLEKLDGHNSDKSLCVEEFLMESEKEWFKRFHNAKLGVKSRPVTPRASSRIVTPAQTPPEHTPSGSVYEGHDGSLTTDDQSLQQFLLPDNYQAPRGLKKLLLIKVYDWPLYAFLLALGQIIAANSYQIVLLTGEVGEKATKLYAIAVVYLVTSVMWWAVFRRFQSVYVLSCPWFFYGFAFFLLGLAPWAANNSIRGWIQNIATGSYAVASSSNAFFFVLNYGSEGSATVSTWGYRACLIQGTQQIYVIALWYWGARITASTNEGVSVTSSATVRGPTVTVIEIAIAVFLWSVGIVLYRGLPNYYRQKPGAIPSFYSSLLKRRVILWFFVFVIIQNLFMSSTVGRNWTYLWSSQHAPTWAIVLLVLLFFVGIWGAILVGFARLSAIHSWILPIFAVGLGAPRWAQMLWGVSGMGVWLPWAGYSYVGSAIAGRALWLWLGVLDAVQGVGFGMILLQTLTRFHMAFTLIVAQVLGSAVTMIARASVSNRLGPGEVFPNFLIGKWFEGDPFGQWSWGWGLHSPWFWGGLLSQVVICGGFLLFFRKEQLSKP